MINKATIARINDEARVEDVVGEFVTLKRRGSNLQGLCPFHNEKSPSFSVNPARNIYKCFGCGKAGGPIQFLIDYQQLSYPDALRYLAKKYNIEIQEEYTSDEDKQRELEQHNLVESIHIANAFAQKFFTEYMLHNEEGRVGLAYFKERGFLTNTIEKFQLGFAPDKGDALTKHALANGFQLEVLKKAGLTSPKEGSTYDFFRNRVMFPIHNLTGKVVGYGGRIMVKDEKAPKYVNTPESEVYLKSKILYGAYFAKNEIRKKDECLVVEGYMDVIALHQAGIENAVASSGTALTEGQIAVIKKITDNVTLIYDGDQAGVNAAIKAGDLMLERDINTSVLFLPDNEDPDSYIRKYGTSGFEEYLGKKKKDYMAFILDFYYGKVKDSPSEKAGLMNALCDVIARIRDVLKRSAYIRESSQKLGMDEQQVITEVNKRIGLRLKELRKAQEVKQEPSEENQPENRDETGSSSYAIRDDFNKPAVNQGLLERDVIRVLLEYGAWDIPVEEDMISVTQYVLDELEGLDIETPVYKLIYEEIKRQVAEGNKLDDKYFTQHEDKRIADVAIELFTKAHTLSENWWTKYKVAIPEKKEIYVKDIQSSILRFKQYRNIIELKKVESLIKEAPEGEEQMKLMKLYKLLLQQKTEFARDIGNVIYRPFT